MGWLFPQFLCFLGFFLLLGTFFDDSCAQTNVFSFGYNSKGQLGDGTFTSQISPVRMTMPGTIQNVPIAACSAGQYYSRYFEDGGYTIDYYSFSIILSATGRALSFGSNRNGQLGDGTTTDRHSPVSVNVDGVLKNINISSISAGSHTLLLSDLGRVFSFGPNNYGQLGDGTTIQRSVPVAVDSLSMLSIKAVSAGLEHSLVLSSSGIVFSFGKNGNGQLGDGTTTSKSIPVGVEMGGVLVTAISAGFDHSLVLSGTGRVFSFGSNLYGQLGDGTTWYSSIPTAVKTDGVLNGVNIAAISAGGWHSLVLSDTGHAFSFGYNNYGQLGDGSKTSRAVPVSVYSSFNITAISAGKSHSLVLSDQGRVYLTGNPMFGFDQTYLSSINTNGVLNGVNITAISAGAEHSLMLSDTGQVFSVGWNFYGQLGDGKTALSETPVAICTPEFVQEEKTISSIIDASAGVGQSLVLSDDATFSFGQHMYNYFTSKGICATTFVPIPITVSRMGMLQGLRPKSISAGTNHALVSSDTGRVFSFGYNSNGQLGDGTTAQRLTPVAVKTDLALNGVFVVSVAAGSEFSLVLSNTGRVFSFGYNNYGQLGDGTTTSKTTPVAVRTDGMLNGVFVTAISAGDSHSLVLSDTGLVFSFGYNGNGQLGDGTTSSSSIPVAVKTDGVLSGKTITAISAGGSHSLVLSDTGPVFSFGFNNIGQLGDGTTTSRSTPVAVRTDGVLSGKTITAISAGGSHSLVLSATGIVFSFGNNSNGQLGDGTTTSRSTPVAVKTDGVLNGVFISGISAGGSHSLLFVEVPRFSPSQIPSNLTATDQFSLQVQAQNSKGRQLSLSGVVNITLNSPFENELIGNTSQQMISGIVQFSNLSIHVVGDNFQITVRADGFKSATSNQFSIRPGPPTSILMNRQPGDGIAGHLLNPQPIIKVLDSFSNQVNGVNITVEISSGGITSLLQGTTSMITIDGMANFTNLRIDKSGTFTLKFKCPSFPGLQITSNPLNVNPGDPSNLSIMTQPGDGIAGHSLNPQPIIKVLDSFSNQVNGVNIIAEISSGGETSLLFGTTSMITIDGMANFTNLRIDKSGTFTLKFKCPSFPGLQITSNPLNVNPGDPSNLSIMTQPGDGIAGHPFNPQPIIKVLDSFSNQVNGVNITVEISSGGITSLLQGTTSMITIDGMANFTNLRIDKSGIFTLKFECPSFPGMQITSNPLNVNPGDPSNLSIMTQPGDGIAGHLLNPQPIIKVSAEDVFGNSVNNDNLNITVEISSGGITSLLQGTTSMITIDGMANFTNLRIDKSGTFTLKFKCPSFPELQITSNPLNVNPGDPSNLSIMTQPGDGIAGHPFSPQPIVQVLDSFSNQVNGVNITVEISSGGITSLLQGTTSMITIDGMANFTGLHINVAGTDFVLEFSCSSGNAPPIQSTPFDVDPDIPSPPLQLHVENITSTSVTISWDSPLWSGGAPLIGYRCELTTTTNSTRLEQQVPFNVTSCLFSDLRASNNFSAVVFSLNIVGQSDPSDSIFVQTSPPDPPSPPTSLSIWNITSSSFTLQWTSPSFDGGIDLDEFEISITLNHTASMSTLMNVPSSLTWVWISGLRSSQEFIIKMRARNSAQMWSSFSSIITCSTLRDETPPIVEHLLSIFIPDTFLPDVVKGTLKGSWSAEDPESIDVDLGWKLVCDGIPTVDWTQLETGAESVFVSDLTIPTFSNCTMFVNATSEGGSTITNSSSFQIRDETTISANFSNGMMMIEVVMGTSLTTMAVSISIPSNSIHSEMIENLAFVFKVGTANSNRMMRMNNERALNLDEATPFGNEFVLGIVNTTSNEEIVGIEFLEPIFFEIQCSWNNGTPALSNPSLCFFNSSSSEWNEATSTCPDAFRSSQFDSEHNTLQVSVCKLSRFRVFDLQIPPVEDTSNSSPGNNDAILIGSAVIGGILIFLIVGIVITIGVVIAIFGLHRFLNSAKKTPSSPQQQPQHPISLKKEVELDTRILLESKMTTTLPTRLAINSLSNSVVSELSTKLSLSLEVSNQLNNIIEEQLEKAVIETLLDDVNKSTLENVLSQELRNCLECGSRDPIIVADCVWETIMLWKQSLTDSQILGLVGTSNEDVELLQQEVNSDSQFRTATSSSTRSKSRRIDHNDTDILQIIDSESMFASVSSHRDH